ncbi:ABC transporter substrate-binding protein [Marivita geojedonensis]|uniref:ABC transporter substrate-binding protein n=1 Tax=Marivita geojedonensis TaxID=1123756 RepID=UPI000D3FCBD4|nr:ABC transporter substrate-binding protein [Marivita geojedonensis]PRY72175.1 branched-chain amino acid transport system substrate-binding protein [Marivita geojedonensis]
MSLTKYMWAAFGLALALIAQPKAGYAQDCTTKIGAVLPTSVDWGRPIAETAQFAVDQVNAAGGVNGCQIEMVLRDTQVDPKVGVDAAKALVDLEGVNLLLGAVSSGVSMPILTSVTVPGGVMQMSCCSSSTAFTKLSEEGKTNGLWFRTFATTGVQSAVAAKVASDQGFKSIAVLYKNDDWGQDMARLIAADFAAVGVEVTASVAINDGQPSYRGEVTEALASQPEALYLALYPAEGTAAVREWISLGGSQKMIMANSLKSDEFRDNVGLQYLGSALGTDTASPRTESADAFRAAYVERFESEPNGPGLANSYDAAMISLLAMQAAGEGATGAEMAAAVPKVTDPNGTPITADTEGFAQARDILAGGGTVSYQGATGDVRFDANGDVSAPAVVWSFNEGGTQEVEYLSLAEVDAFIGSLK